MSQGTAGREDAEQVAIAALGFIAGNAGLLSRFVAVTGIEPSRIRTAAVEPGFLAGVLNFVLAHEPTLLEFAQETGIKPESVGRALRMLPSGNDEFERST